MSETMEKPVKTVKGSAKAPASARRAPRALAADEIETILERSWWGVLATTVDGHPYAVPVAFGYDGEAFFIATGPGRKLDNLLANPAACLTITEVEEGGALWRSVVVTGSAAPVETLGARLYAFNVLRRQVAEHRKPVPRDASKVATATVLKLVPDERAGRACDR